MRTPSKSSESPDKSPNLITLTDPLSSYPFQISSPIPLSFKHFPHPIYQESFDKLYKFAKKAILTDEKDFSIDQKRLAFSALLFKLSEPPIELIVFKQFPSLKLSYRFFLDFENLSTFFFVVPRLKFSSKKFRNKLPKFRITSTLDESFFLWVNRCNELIAGYDRYLAENSYDEEFILLNVKYQKWKAHSNRPFQLPKPIIHYLFTCQSFPPALRSEAIPYLTLSSGELYLSNKAKSTEAFHLFWGLLELIDFIECNPYQNSITFSITKWLKAKVEEWVKWEPSMFDISLDYRLLEKKNKALKNIKDFWIKEAETHKAEAPYRKELGDAVMAKLKAMRAQTEASPSPIPSPSFTIIPKSL